MYNSYCTIVPIMSNEPVKAGADLYLLPAKRAYLHGHPVPRTCKSGDGQYVGIIAPKDRQLRQSHRCATAACSITAAHTHTMQTTVQFVTVVIAGGMVDPDGTLKLVTPSKTVEL